MGKLRQKVAKDSFWNILTIILGKAGALIFTIFLARFLLPEGFGNYTLATSVALLFITFADLGINQTMMRYVSSEFKKNKQKATAYFSYILKLKLILVGISSLLLLILAYPISIIFFKNNSLLIPIILSSLYVFFLAFIGFFESLFFIMNKVRYLAVKELVFQAIRIILVLIVFYFLASSYFVSGSILVLIISNLLALSFLVYFSYKNLPYLFEKTKTKINKNRILKFLFYIIILNISAVFFSYIDIIMIGFFLSPEYVGYYRAAFVLILGLLGLLGLSNIFLPVLSRINEDQVSNVFNSILKYSMILAVPATVGMLFLSSYVLKFVYGNSYLLATLPLFFLSPLIIIITIAGDLQTLFSAREKPRALAKLMIFITIINIILNLVLITALLKYSPIWAITGAAIATLLSWTIYLLWALILARKQLSYSLDWKSLIKPAFASAIMGLGLFAFKFFVKDMTLILGILEVIFGTIIYLFALFLINGTNKKDLILFLGIFKKS